MTDPTPFETRCAQTLQELRGCPAVKLRWEHLGPVSPPMDDVEAASARVSELANPSLGRSMRHRYFRNEQIAAEWRTVDPYPLLVGEFQLDHLYRCLTEFGPDIEPRTRDDEPVEDLEVFDQVPRGGSGCMAGVQAVPDAGGHTIWHYDMRRGTIPLDLDYAGYLDNLLVTKGVSGWQYLFADISFADGRFAGYGDDLKTMLEIFPEIFPDHDYTPLAERLAQRR